MPLWLRRRRLENLRTYRIQFCRILDYSIALNVPSEFHSPTLGCYRFIKCFSHEFCQAFATVKVSLGAATIPHIGVTVPLESTPASSSQLSCIFRAMLVLETQHSSGEVKSFVPSSRIQNEPSSSGYNHNYPLSSNRPSLITADCAEVPLPS
jgi:hypothetical protein